MGNQHCLPDFADRIGLVGTLRRVRQDDLGELLGRVAYRFVRLALFFRDPVIPKPVVKFCLVDCQCLAPCGKRLPRRHPR